MIGTVWGYDVDADEIPPLLTPDEFAAMSGGRFKADDPRVAPALGAASAAIRSLCGWHVAPELPCHCPILADDRQRVYALPTLRLSGVSRVVERGVELPAGSCEWTPSGAVRRCGWRCWPDMWDPAEIWFDSGFDAEAAPDLAAVAYQIAANAVAAAPGVRSESVGDVSTEYNQTASGVSGGVALLDRDKDLLAPYRLRELR